MYESGSEQQWQEKADRDNKKLMGKRGDSFSAAEQDISLKIPRDVLWD